MKDNDDAISVTEAVNYIMREKGCGRRKAERILLKLLRSGEVASYFVPDEPPDAAKSG